jgi:hypothetical protein
MPRFDPQQLDRLVSDLETAESDLTAKTDADGAAKAAAARASGDLSAAQATNRAAVKGLKDYAASLTDEGETPTDPNALPADQTAGTQPAGSTQPAAGTAPAGTPGMPTQPAPGTPASDGTGGA